MVEYTLVIIQITNIKRLCSFSEINNYISLLNRLISEF